MAWIHESKGRPGKTGMLVVALLCAGAGVVGLLAGKDLTQQVFGPVVAFAVAALFLSLSLGERGHALSVDEDRLRWRWHPGVRGVSAEVALAELRELHRESEPPVLRDGRPERRRVQQAFVVLADGRRRKLPPAVMRDWTSLVRELRAVRPDLKVVERETDDFTGADP
jgi:hypothetical protein